MAHGLTETDLPADPGVEWDRVRQFATAPQAPLAVIEVESSTQAEDVVAAMKRLRGEQFVHVYRLGPDATSGDLLDSLGREQQQASAPLFLLLAAETTSPEPEWASAFWIWANAQRERLRPTVGTLAFVLTPMHVNLLARHADALWDWIPLKFNLLRSRPSFEARAQHESMDPNVAGSATPGSVVQTLPALRQQLLHAREQGLSEAVVRREYAWPLFRALCDADHLREAVALLDRDLAGDFGAELPTLERGEWWHTVGVLYLDLWRIPDAERAFLRLLEHARQFDDWHAEAAACVGLGRVHQERRDLVAAEAWYQRLAELCKKLGNERGAATSYHQLGVIAQERRDFATAEAWYRKSLEIKQKQGDEHGAAITYHQLGMTAEEQRDFAAAEAWYRKALAISERLGIEHFAASTYNQLGRIAQQRGDFAAAEAWCRKSLEISERLGIEHGAAITYHQLGMIAEERQAFAVAEAWYRKSLQIVEKQGNEHGAAITYHQLGTIAQEQREFAAAEAWYRKALAISEKLGIKHSAASTYGQLGVLAGLQERLEDSARWLIKSIMAFARCDDPHAVQRTVQNFMVTYGQAPADVQAKLAVMWREAGLGDLPRPSAE